METQLNSKEKVSLSSLFVWAKDGVVDKDHPLESGSGNSKFPVNEVLNNKIYLWKGDVCKLDVDCIVNPTNEALCDTNSLSQRILSLAGPEIEAELTQHESCRTGEAKVTKGYNLFARCVIHTVGPRYHQKYKLAAENALHSCYRSCLQAVKENKLHSVAIPPINSEKRDYPPLEGAHIAIRTVRRFLEHFGDGIDEVVFCVEKNEDFEIYRSLLPLYFPRNFHEERTAEKLLPADTGNEYGETVVEERKIRIAATPLDVPYDQQYSSEDEDDDSLRSVVASGLTKMAPDPDKSRKIETPQPTSTENMDIAQRHAFYLQRAKTTNLNDIAKLDIVYRGGVDSKGNTIIVAIGKNLPETGVHIDRVMMYVVKLMESISGHKYSLVYFHTGMDNKSTPDYSFLKELHSIFDAKYGKNIQAIYIVQPTFLLKMFFTVLSPFLSKNFKDKLQYVDNLNALLKMFTKEQLHLPPSILNDIPSSTAATTTTTTTVTSSSTSASSTSNSASSTKPHSDL